MPWTGEPETEVTRMTFTEWTFALAPKREVQIGYSVRVQGAWELFGNDHWLWFTGEVRSFRGAVQIVAHWAEVEWSGGGAGGGSGGGGGGAGGSGGGAGGGREGLTASLAVKPLKGQRVRRVALEGDLRYLPVDALWTHLDGLLHKRRRSPRKRRSAK